MRRLISDLYLRTRFPRFFYSISPGGDRKLKYDKVAVISSGNRIDPLTVGARVTSGKSHAKPI